MRNLLQKLIRQYLKVRVRNAGQLGTMDFTSGKIKF